MDYLDLGWHHDSILTLYVLSPNAISEYKNAVHFILCVALSYEVQDSEKLLAITGP